MRQSHFRTYGGWPPAVGESYCWTFGLCVFEWTGSHALREARSSGILPLAPNSFFLLVSLWSLQYGTPRARAPCL